MKWAYIQNGWVHEIFELPDDVSVYSVREESFADQCMKVPDFVQEGYILLDGSFILPDLKPLEKPETNNKTPEFLNLNAISYTLADKLYKGSARELDEGNDSGPCSLLLELFGL